MVYKNHVLLLFIFTRPFGATFGDFLTKSLSKGGLELGTINSSSVSFIIIAIQIYIAHIQNNRKIIIEKNSL